MPKSASTSGYPCPYCSTVATYGHNLRTHLMGSKGRGGHELSSDEAALVVSGGANGTGERRGVAKASSAPVAGVRPDPVAVAVRRGHYRSLALLENTRDTSLTLAMYELVSGHPVYLRPTDKGLTVISLDPSTPAMVGVGGAGDCCIAAIPPSRDFVETAARDFRIKVGAMGRASHEERYAIARIRAALSNGLALEQDLFFLHQEWRFSSADKIDFLALDGRAGQVVVIELKGSEAAALRERDNKGRTATEQVVGYTTQLIAHAADVMPFLQRLAGALSRIYRPGLEELRLNTDLPPRWEIWWPEGKKKQPREERVAVSTAARTDLATASPFDWRAELRSRQSRWREAHGYVAGLHKGQPLGSRLAMPDAEENLWNFLTPAIGELVRREFLANKSRPSREQKVYEHPRLFDNLLSSQPLAFNLFGEFALDLARATDAARALWPGRVDTVTRIEFEWSPGRWDPRYLDNGTAADVAIFHTTPSGGAGAIFVETKYHEDLRGKTYRVKPRYLDVAKASGAFAPDGVETVREGWLQQIWFDHLLALATRDADGLESILFLVVYPEINQRCRDAATAYRRALDPSGIPTFDARTLEELIPVLGNSAGTAWAVAFTERYLTPTVTSKG